MSTIIVEKYHRIAYTIREVMMVLTLKLQERMVEKNITTRQLSEMTGIRWNTVDDMAKNRSKHWSPENLEKIMRVLEIEDITALIEYKKDPKE